MKNLHRQVRIFCFVLFCRFFIIYEFHQKKKKKQIDQQQGKRMCVCGIQFRFFSRVLCVSWPLHTINIINRKRGREKEKPR